MFKLKVSAIFLLLSLGAAAAEPQFIWQGHQFQEVASLSAIPEPIKQQLAMAEPGLRGVADKGRPFNVTDVVDTSLPMRRLLAAGQDGDTWLIALEQGGRGYSVQTYLFVGGELKKHWVLGRVSMLRAVLDKIPEPADEG